MYYRPQHFGNDTRDVNILLLLLIGFLVIVVFLWILQDKKVMSGSMEGPFSVLPNRDQPPEGQIWSLQMAVVTALIHSGGEKVLGGSLVESAFTYIAALKDSLLSSLRAPVPGLDTQGRKKAKLQQPRTTISALQVCFTVSWYGVFGSSQTCYRVWFW